MEERERFAGAMARLAVAVGCREEISPARMELYYEVLTKYFFIDEIERGIEETIISWTSLSFPPLGVIFKNTERVACSPETAWEKLVRAVEQGRLEKLGDRTAEAVVELMGGWYSVSRWSVEELSRRREEFLKLYRELFRTLREGYLKEKRRRLRDGSCGERALCESGGKHGKPALEAK